LPLGLPDAPFFGFARFFTGFTGLWSTLAQTCLHSEIPQIEHFGGFIIASVPCMIWLLAVSASVIGVY
jgi:hypothetical protein